MIHKSYFLWTRRWINLVLLMVLLISAFLLISERYSARVLYSQIWSLNKQEKKLELDYTKLQIEYGTYYSKLNLQRYALRDIGLVVPDKEHIMEIKSNVSQ